VKLNSPLESASPSPKTSPLVTVPAVSLAITRTADPSDKDVTLTDTAIGD